MMERSLTFFQFDSHWFELSFLLIAEHSLNCLHLIGQARDRQKIPTMTAGDIVYAAVLARRIVQPDPAGKVGHRQRPRPIRIVLMPGHNAAMMRRLVENLI